MLTAANPVFHYPNQIGPTAWAGWVQERGLYFLGEKDPKYADLVSMIDSFKDNPGEKLGSLVKRSSAAPLAVCRLGAVAATAGGDGRRLSIAGEPDESGEGAASGWISTEISQSDD